MKPNVKQKTIVCKNCGNKFNGNFCNECGQSAEAGRINFKTLIHDIQLGFFAFDKGILYTLKQLSTRPGRAIREYIEGKRIRHFKPFSLLIILATAVGLLKFYFLPNSNPVKSIAVQGIKNNVFDLNFLNEWIASNSAIMALVVIPFYAIGTYLVFRKNGYNYSEHLVLNAYVSGLRLMLDIVTFPLVYFFYNKQGHNIIDFAILLGAFALTVWTYIQFFSGIKLVSLLKKILLTYIIYFAQLIIVMLLVAAVITVL